MGSPARRIGGNPDASQAPQTSGRTGKGVPTIAEQQKPRRFLPLTPKSPSPERIVARTRRSIFLLCVRMEGEVCLVDSRIAPQPALVRHPGLVPGSTAPRTTSAPALRSGGRGNKSDTTKEHNTPFVPSAVEGRDRGDSLGAGPSTALGTNGAVRVTPARPPSPRPTALPSPPAPTPRMPPPPHPPSPGTVARTSHSPPATPPQDQRLASAPN